MEKLSEILFISSLKGVGKKTAHKKYLSAVKSCENTEDLIKNYIPRIKVYSKGDLDAASEKARKLEEQIAESNDCSVLTFLDNQYPKRLRMLGNAAPLVLYIRGNVSILSGNSVAVIGTRNPSPHTVLVEQNLVAKSLEISAPVVISGLALGCDSVAHSTTLREDGKTVAVLPSGVKNIVPPQNLPLAERIIENGGCLVSEYPLDADSFRGTFIERDKLIAALADITIVMECAVKSGTMHTVHAAVELRKTVGAYLPSNISKGDYSGNMHMINELGAVPLRNTNDLCRLLKSN